MTERGSSYEESYLTEDDISAQLLADTLSDVLTTLIVTVKMRENKVQTKLTMTMKR